MVREPNVVTVLAAAKEKGCTPQALYKALDEGRLHEVRMGRTRLILRDKTYRDFEARPYADKRKVQNQPRRED